MAIDEKLQQLWADLEILKIHVNDEDVNADTYIGESNGSKLALCQYVADNQDLISDVVKEFKQITVPELKSVYEEHKDDHGLLLDEKVVLGRKRETYNLALEVLDAAVSKEDITKLTPKAIGSLADAVGYVGLFTDISGYKPLNQEALKELDL